MTETFTPLLQFRAGSRTFASGASNLPTGETPLAPSLRSGFSIPHSPSAQAGELAGVGKPQGPGLTIAGLSSRRSWGLKSPPSGDTPHWRALMPRTDARASDRAHLLFANPHVFVEAAQLLEQLLPLLHADGEGGKVRLDGTITPALADALAVWGADLTDHEDDDPAEDGHDAEAGSFC
jgi:hypothetical protein